MTGRWIAPSTSYANAGSDARYVLRRNFEVKPIKPWLAPGVTFCASTTSRSVEPLAEDANQNGQLVLVGGCISLSGESIPYAPMAEVVRQICRKAGALGTLSEHAITEIEALLQPRMDQLPHNRAEMFERTLGLLELIRPTHSVLVLVLEDGHWALFASSPAGTGGRQAQGRAHG